MMPKVSVVIPAYNAEKTIEKCIESVLANDYGNFEIILVYDKSEDKTKDIIKRFNDTRLKFFANKIRFGASFCRNYAIKKSEADLVLLLDSDSYVERDWISRHLRAHKEIPADIIGGGIMGIYNTIYGKCDDFCSWFTSIPYSKSYYLVKLHLATNNMSIKKSVFDKIGYFNESLHTGEDADFCYRALRNKLEIYLKSDLVIYHYNRDDIRGFLKHQENWGKHAIEVRKKSRMDFSFLLPSSYLIAHLYIVPLAILYTVFIVLKWIRYKPSVLLCAPIILLAKIKQANAIKNSLNPSTACRQ